MSTAPAKLAVLTSGGDSPGMNAAVRAVVRSGLAAGLEVFAVYEGLQGLVDGGDRIRSVSSADVGMVRNCGYLALMGSLATGANFVLIPESPPGPDWQTAMCDVLHSGRGIGRRANIVIVAEGVRDTNDQPVTAAHVKAVLEDRLGEDARVTILGHVQRGGSPSAFDRYLGTVLGYAAVHRLLSSPGGEPQLVGIQGHHVTYSPLTESVARTRSVASLIANQEFDAAMAMRGGSFTDSYRLLRTIVQALPRHLDPGQQALRLAVWHGGDPAPGMNAAVRVALRVAMDRGHTVLAVADGFRGLLASRIEPLDWMSVSGWVSRPGAELGTNRFVPGASDLSDIAAQLDSHRVDGILVIGGWAGYLGAHRLVDRLEIPVVCVPASINNDLPASDLSIGADTALNSIVTDVDKIKQSAVASHRCFVVEVMGEDCGFLALMGGIATGAERVYLPEEGITLERLSEDLDALRTGFAHGKRLGLVIRGEGADALYTTSFIVSLFNHESNGLFDVRGAILGHVQDGGQPSPFDRIQATRLTAAAVDHLIARAGSDDPASAIVGMRDGTIVFTPLQGVPDLVDGSVQRPPGWWMALRPLADSLAAVER